LIQVRFQTHFLCGATIFNTKAAKWIWKCPICGRAVELDRIRRKPLGISRLVRSRFLETRLLNYDRSTGCRLSRYRPGRMRQRIGKLYHLAEAGNLASILQYDLMSTERLLDLAFLAKRRSRRGGRAPTGQYSVVRQRGDPRSSTECRPAAPSPWLEEADQSFSSKLSPTDKLPCHQS
jgi:hypothetical protein